MNVLLVSSYQVDTPPPGFYHLFEELVSLSKELKKHGFSSHILSDRKNTPWTYLTKADRLATILDCPGLGTRINLAKKLLSPACLFSKPQTEIKILFSQDVPSISEFLLTEKFNAAIVFGGARDDSQVINHELSAAGLPVVFIERGWLPQRDHFYYDLKGTNGYSSLLNNPLADVPKDEILQAKNYLAKHYSEKKTQEGPIVVVLQYEPDASIRYFSPYFKSNRNFLKYLSNLFKGHEVVFCPHPLETSKGPEAIQQKYSALVRSDFELCPKGVNTLSLIPNAKMVVTINSTLLIESLAYGKNVIAYGIGVFSGNNVVLESDLHTTKDEIMEFKPNQEAVENFLVKLLRVQFHKKDITKLVQVLKQWC